MARLHPTAHSLIVALLCCGACDCEERLRKTISNPGKRTEVDAASKPSGPSETEPNDNASQASAIIIGNELRPVAGEIDLPEDVDWFAFEVEGEPASFEVKVEGDTSLDISLHVDVPNGAPLSYDVGRRGDPERIPSFRIGSEPQKLAIRSESNSTGEYTIRLERHLGTGLEAEPNDETNVATQFAVPGEIQGYYDRSDDRDVYRLDGEAETPYVLEIGPVSGVRQIARIFQDSKLTKPEVTVQVSEEPVRIPNLSLSRDAVRWLVLTPLAKGDPNTPYRVRVAAHPPLAESKALELEPNDETGMKLTQLPATIVGYLHSADDRDRFRIVPEKADGEPSGSPVAEREDEIAEDPLAPYRKERRGETASATLEWDDESIDLGLRWVPDPGSDGKEFRRSSRRERVRACGLSLGDGGLLEVRSARLDSKPTVGQPTYTLSIEQTGSDGGWEVEPNDDRDDADVLEAGTAREGALAASEDIDNWVFSVDAPEGETRSVSLSAGGEGVDLVMRVLDDGGGVVANMDDAAVGGMEKLQSDLPKGLYGVQLRWKSGEFCAPYRVTFE